MTQVIQRITAGKMGKKLDQVFTPFLTNILQAHELPGLALGVVVDGEIAYARGFGVKSLVSGGEVTAGTLFHMASISKPFVATAILQLVEQNKVDLGAPVVAYLPYFHLADERYRQISVEQMLSHISGMPDVEDYEWQNPQYDAGALERYVRSIACEKLLSDPGATYAYSNMAFECLGDLIARVSGISFDDYGKQNILDLAGMAESTFLMPRPLPESWAAPHLRILGDVAWEGYPYNRMHGPSSTLHSNAVEMCRWAITNLNQGSFEGRQVLRSNSYDLLWQPRAEVREGRQVGLSWFLAEYRGEKTVEHGGGDTGFRSYLMLLPARGAAVVVMCNLIPAPVEAIARAALDVVLGEAPGAIPPGALLPVRRTLVEAGPDAAAAEWERLKAEHPEEYNFNAQPFSALYNAVEYGKEVESLLLARLCARVLPESELQAIAEDFCAAKGLLAQEVCKVLTWRPGM